MATDALREKTSPLLVLFWRYGRHELLYLCWAAMEVALLAPVVLTLMPWSRYWPPGRVAVWLALLILIPFNVSRVFSLSNAPIKKQRRVILGSFLIAVLVAWHVMLSGSSSLLDFSWPGQLVNAISEPGNPLLRRYVILFFTIAFAWWRGLSLTGRAVDIRELGTRVRVMILLVPVVILISHSRLAEGVVPFVLLFFLAVLMAIAFTRAEQIELEKSGQGFPMSPRWMAVIFGVSVVIVTVAAVLAAAGGGQTLPAAVEWLSPLWRAFYFLGNVAFLTLGYLVTPLEKPVGWLIQRLYELLRGLLSGMPNLPQGLAQPFAERVAEEQGRELTEMVQQPRFRFTFIANRLILFGTIIVAALIIYFVLNRYFRHRQMALADQEQFGRVPGEGGAFPRPGLGQRILDRLGIFQRWRAAASIRRIYRQMSQVAAGSGYPRGLSETPYEYLDTLAEAWPEDTADTRLITDAYVNVRYGEIPETQAELDEIREAWRRLERQKPAE